MSVFPVEVVKVSDEPEHGPKERQCARCGKWLKSAAALGGHMWGHKATDRREAGEPIRSDSAIFAPGRAKNTVICPVCKATLHKSSINKHLRNIHSVSNNSYTPPPKARDLAKPKPEVVNVNEPIDADALINVILRAVFPENIPIDKLDAVLAWREATINFLRLVQ